MCLEPDIAFCTFRSVEEFPQRPGHKTPAWVPSGALFHVRIRVDRSQPVNLIDPALAPELLEAARRYHRLAHWSCELFLLMPDHIHALIRFSRDADLAKIVGNWKQGVAHFQKVRWQENFFDHRLRSAKERQEKWLYIRRNPVVKALCVEEDDWPYVCAPSSEIEEAR
jgi:putative transposase